MADPAHRSPKPRMAVVIIPRTAYVGALWLVLSWILGGLRDWTGWWPLAPFSSWALIIALGYLVAATIQRSRRARRR